MKTEEVVQEMLVGTVHAKSRFTFVLSISKSGELLRTMIILKVFNKKLHALRCRNSWWCMNEKLMLH